jgi:LacI family transcriptional regulator
VRTKVITIRDVARTAGVATGTASNALSGRPSVAPELKARVLAAATRLNYRPNAVAANLRRGDSRTVGLCIPALNNPFFCDLMQRLVVCAEEDNFDVLVLETREDGSDEAKKLNALYSNRVRGVFMVPTGTWTGDRDTTIPMVIVDRIRPGEAMPSVALDNPHAARSAFRHLYDLGHRSIWMVVNSKKIWNSKQRVDGFKAAAKRLKVTDARVLEVGMTPQETAHVVHAALAEARPTAIVAASGIATLGTLRAIQDHGISIPDEISVLGFDDVPWMEVLRPSISVVAQPIDQIAHHAWRLMKASFADSSIHDHVLVDAHIIDRESTRRVA